MELQEHTRWLMTKGLSRSPVPLMWLNGVLIPVPEATPSLDKDLMQKVWGGGGGWTTWTPA